MTISQLCRFAALAANRNGRSRRAGWAAEGPPPPAPEAPASRLPPGARPTGYEVTLTIVPGEAKATGEIAIDIELDRPHPLLWLNADALTVARAATEVATTRATVVQGSEQVVGIAFEPPLAAGRHRVTLAFEAE